MRKLRKQHSAELKSRVALAAIGGERTINELASHYEVHPTMVTKWKKQAVAAVSQAFLGRATRAEASTDGMVASLYEQIGRQKVELDWLKKKLLPGG